MATDGLELTNCFNIDSNRDSEGETLMYPYCEAWGAGIGHSNRKKDNDGEDYVIVHIERPREGGFDTVRFNLPDFEMTLRDGFTDDEIERFRDFVKTNSIAMWEYSKTGGVINA